MGHVSGAENSDEFFSAWSGIGWNGIFPLFYPCLSFPIRG